MSRAVAPITLVAVLLTLLLSGCAEHPAGVPSPAATPARTLSPRSTGTPPPTVTPTRSPTDTESPATRTPTSPPEPTSTPATLLLPSPELDSWTGPLLYHIPLSGLILPVYDLGTGLVHGIPTAEEVWRVLDWSPNGCAFAYLSRPHQGQRSQVRLLDLDNGTDAWLLSPPISFPSPGIVDLQWSPSGEWMAYSGGLHTPESEIFLIRPDGSEELQLTNNDCGDGYPQWSFDGQHLFYWSFCQEGEFLLEGTTELNVIEIATMHQWGALRYTLPFESWADLAITDAQTMEPLALEFPEEPQTVSLIEVYWTPDLSHFVVVTCEGDTEFGCFGTRLYWVDVGDATVRLIEPDNADPTVEAVFPDGSRLLLRTRDEGRGFWHYTLDMETGETELLTRELGLGWDFAFSPDGTMLSYVRPLNQGSYVFDLSSGELTRLPELLPNDPDLLSWLPRMSYGPGACTQESAGP